MTTTAPPAVAPPPAPANPPKKKPRRLRRWLIASGVAVVLVVGAAGVAGKLLWDSVSLGEPLPLPATTTLRSRDGAILAELGENRRYVLSYEEIAPIVRDVAVAAEDPDFWSDWASPISRAAVRVAYDLAGDDNNARVRAFILARKAEDAWGKEEVLRRYLNDIPFGRQSFGIEAAARAYFAKSASSDAPQAQRLTTAEAMYLLTLAREPYPDDPAAAQQRSQARFEEIRAQLVARGTLSAQEAQSLTYPVVRPELDLDSGLDRPSGMVAHHVMSELSGSENPSFAGLSWQEIRDGGYAIITTLDSRAQSSLEAALDASVSSSVLYGEPADLLAAGVVIDPATGGVLAYYGGHTGTGVDLAGTYTEADGKLAGFGAHPAGGSFAVQVLATAARAGFSIESRWPWAPHPVAGRAPDNPIVNSSTCPTAGNACTLRESTQRGLEVPLYDVTSTVGAGRVLETAAAMGFDAIWDDEGERHDLRTEDPTQLLEAGFGAEVGLGQFSVTVIDQANAMATLAAGGQRARAHFVQEVRRGDDVLYQETLPSPDAPRVLSAGQVVDIGYVLSQRAGRNDLAIQSGAWLSDAQPTDAWSLGYTRHVAVAIWLGSQTGQQPLRDSHGASIYGAGAPTYALLQVVDGVQAAMELTPVPFPPPVYAGDVDPVGSVPS